MGETLTASTSGIQDADGRTGAVFSYQWLADGAVIAGANRSTFTLISDDEGRTIRVRVTFTDDEGHEESLTSDPTAAAAPPPNTPAAGAPTITGTAQVGETLTAVTSGIEDADGLDHAAFAYQWLAGDAEINGATASAYILAEDDAGKAVKVRVNFTDDAGNEESLTSAATGAVATPPNTPATGAPTISGTTQVGETLTAGTSNISDGDGLDDAAFAYQWLADDAEINGATASAYTLAGDDEGKAVKVRVSFTDDAGNPEALTSQATAAVAEAAPTGPPPAPQNLTAVVNGDGQIVLSWEAPGDDSITGYQVLRPEAHRGGGHPAGVCGGHAERRHHLHGHERHPGSAACLPGEGDQRRRAQQAVQLCQRDPVGLERDGRGQRKHPQYMRRARCSPSLKGKGAPQGPPFPPSWGRPPQGSHSPPGAGHPGAGREQAPRGEAQPGRGGEGAGPAGHGPEPIAPPGRAIPGVSDFEPEPTAARADGRTTATPGIWSQPSGNPGVTSMGTGTA